MGDTIPVWHDARNPPPEPGWYLVIALVEDVDYVVQRDCWSLRMCGWDGGISVGEPLPGSVVAWAEEP